jgi:nucleoside-diphosphate-sugar epimerase
LAPIPTRGVVAVTGAAGFLGSWTVRKLLDHGYRVRACVRTTADPARCDFLRAMPGYASGRLTLHGADLDRERCYDEIFKGCHGVAHVSHIGDYDDQDYVRRTCDHIIASVNGSGSVSRLVVTSSVGAVMSEILCEDNPSGGPDPKRPPARGQANSMGKLVAERAFVAAAEASESWDVITVCPGDTVGPILSAHQKNMGPWQSLIRDMLEGACKQSAAYRPWMTVDVRDAALCHVRLLESAEVKGGERYVAWSTEKRHVEDISADIARLLPELGYVPAPVIGASRGLGAGRSAQRPNTSGDGRRISPARRFDT